MRKSCRIFLWSLVACVALCLLGGCGRREARADWQALASDPETIVLGAGRHLAPGEKDGYYCSKTLRVWEPLITHDERGLPKPCLAESWEMLDGGRIWVFHLRRGVTFHDGTAFDAEAVSKNFDRMRLGVKRSSFYGLDIKTFYPSLLRYEKVDRHTLRLVFSEPNINQLYKMMDFGSPMYSPAGFDENGDFSGFASGTGPYKIVENERNRYVKLERYDAYYGEKAKTKYIVVKNIPSADVRYSALKSGEILGVLDLNAIPPFLADELKKDDRFAISTNKSTMLRFLALNGKKAPFNDVRMRQAVSLALNRAHLVEALYLNYAKPAANLLNYTSPYYREIPARYDLAQAKRLAREVLGDRRCEVLYCINGSDPLQKGEAELIAYWLQEIGLDVSIQSLEYATMIHQIRRGEYHIARLQQGLANGDPYAIFYTFMMPDGGRNVGSSLGYRNEEVERLLARAKHAEDEGERRGIYARLQEISVEEQPVAPLFYDRSIVAYSKRLKNYHARTYGVDLAVVALVDEG